MAVRRRLLGGLVSAALALAGVGMTATPASAATPVAKASLHSHHANNENKTIDTTVVVYDDGNVYGTSTVESGVWLTGVRLCAKALLVNRDGMVIGQVGGDCWGVNGTALGYSKRTENWAGQVPVDIARQTFAVSIVHWNNGIDWSQVVNFVTQIWTIYKSFSSSGADASANDIQLPNYQLLSYGQDSGGGGGGGGHGPLHPHPNDP
ncbi:hypothetical protein [Actinocrispum wychmicini]|uniref:Uncharacterized protein n=1 Tax=Actinocrispum wychmicini TaxID=1213861 RepID=A0A4R2IQ58_9PSEU|nr:hypothetical protein [Actinocrispum wychmicini]TCO46466.1 hypothetical protein EV192_11945 [Actinocrispum wychmicini]